MAPQGGKEDLVARVFTPHDGHRGIKAGRVVNRRYQDLARLLTLPDSTFELIQALPEAASWSPHFRLDIFPASFFDDESEILFLHLMQRVLPNQLICFALLAPQVDVISRLVTWIKRATERRDIGRMHRAVEETVALILEVIKSARSSRVSITDAMMDYYLQVKLVVAMLSLLRTNLPPFLTRRCTGRITTRFASLVFTGSFQSERFNSSGSSRGTTAMPRIRG